MASKLICLALASLLVGMVAAADQAKEARAYQHPLTNLPPGGEITTAFMFPEHANKKFPAGDRIKVVLGLHNDASEAYNLTAIMGSLNIPQDFSFYVQNFTQQFYLQPLSPNEEATVEYTFRPDPSLAPREFIVALTLFYQDSKGSFMSTTFFNQTIEVVEKEKMIDTELIMMYITLLALFGLAAYGIFQYLQSLGLMKKKTKKTKSKGPSVPHVQNNAEEWIEGTAYQQWEKQKSKKSLQQRKKD